MLHIVSLPGVSSDPTRLDLPSIHYSGNTYGTGIFPRPDPRCGFSFRADRMGQPAIHLRSDAITWSYFAESEAPSNPEPELLYSLGVEPARTGDLEGLSLNFRYPQREYGHRGDGGPDAYVAKDTYAEGEASVKTWQSGDVFEKTLYLWPRPQEAAQAYADTTRFLWERAYPKEAMRSTSSLWWQAGQHIRWYNARLYNPGIGGGHYESPEGSGTAMLGFVEQSLLMASTTLVYANLALQTPSPPIAAEELQQLKRRATDVLIRWVREGCSPEGLLYPYCDAGGYGFGYRKYSDYENLTIVKDEGFDSIRLATESRSLLSAAASARLAGDAEGVNAWEDAAVAAADWLINHALPGGGYSSRYKRNGDVLDPYAGGTGAAISLFCDCTRLLRGRASRTAESYLQAALDAYESNFAAIIRSGGFAGGTLDASTADREAAVAALDACLQLYELSGDDQYLLDATLAAGNLLSYTMVYPITTFGVDTDAVRSNISTFGATIVSPENQHLDPVPTAPGMVLYGLYAGDEICVQAGIESLKFALDGRWAIAEAEGLKQSEQLLHTRWYYNDFFSRRGDFRRGMPLWGRTDSEHGWPQVVPSAAFLGTGQVLLDWHTGRAAGVDGWRIEQTRKENLSTVWMQLSRDSVVPQEQSTSLLLRVLRLPEGGDYRVTLETGDTKTNTTSARLGSGFILSIPQMEAITLAITLPFGD
jgi:hypothetical protein